MQKKKTEPLGIVGWILMALAIGGIYFALPDISDREATEIIERRLAKPESAQ